jgi:hypothetical protein
MTPSDDAKLLAYAASRAKGHPHYLGWVFARYGELENISEHDLAEILSTTSHNLLRLGLCLRPRADHFAEDIEQIRDKFNIDAIALATVVRLVESVEAIAAGTGTVSAESGLLMAARAQKKKRKRQDKRGRNDDQSES